ncbi:MAG: ABC transporter ATP-binding protein [Bacillota bacterium]
MLLRATGLCKRYRTLLVFDRVDLEVGRGQCLVITGANGSGKSTLLKILAGLLLPTSGQVEMEIDGRSLTAAQRRRLTGWVSPELTLYDELSARENLSFFARVRGVTLDVRTLDSTLSRLGLTQRADDPLSTYSSGMKQRVKYGFAIMHRPPFLFLDEPGTTMDESGARLLADIIDEQKRHGLVVLATNDREETAYGDRRLRLDGTGTGRPA